jgi:hypothetical protein
MPFLFQDEEGGTFFFLENLQGYEEKTKCKGFRGEKVDEGKWQNKTKTYGTVRRPKRNTIRWGVGEVKGGQARREAKLEIHRPDEKNEEKK